MLGIDLSVVFLEKPLEQKHYKLRIIEFQNGSKDILKIVFAISNQSSIDSAKNKISSSKSTIVNKLGCEAVISTIISHKLIFLIKKKDFEMWL